MCLVDLTIYIGLYYNVPSNANIVGEVVSFGFFSFL